MGPMETNRNNAAGVAGDGRTLATVSGDRGGRRWALLLRRT
jgi:hypothetical protein